MGWFVVVGLVVVGLVAALVYRQRHQTDPVATLATLRGQQLDLAIAPPSSPRSTIGEYTAVIDSIEPTTRWVTFEWITRMEGGQVGALSPDDLAHGVIADCVHWVRPWGQALIDLK
jgi:hypothetical protein